MFGACSTAFALMCFSMTCCVDRGASLGDAIAATFSDAGNFGLASAAETEPFLDAEASAGMVPESDGDNQLVQVDCGANVNLAKERSIVALSQTVDPRERVLHGVCDGNVNTILQTISVGMQVPNISGGPPIESVVVAGDAPSARRTLLATSVLWDMHRAVVLCEPEMLVRFLGRGSTRLYRINGVYFIKAKFVKGSACASVAGASMLPAQASAASRARSVKQLGEEKMALLVAARFGCTSRTLRLMIAAEPELGLPKLSEATARTVDSDIFRARAFMRAAPASRSDSDTYRKPGSGRWGQVDVWGPAPAADPIHGWRFNITCVILPAVPKTSKGDSFMAPEMGDDDVSTGRHYFAYEALSVRHTNVEVFAVCQWAILEEQALEHDIEGFWFDQGPEMTCGGYLADSGLPAELRKIGKLAKFAGREHHESMSVVGAHQQRCTRLSEGFQLRASRAAGWQLRAREYASRAILLSPPRNSQISHYAFHTNSSTPLWDPPMPVWGTTVVVNERHPSSKAPGNGSFSAWVSGIHDKKYVLVKANGTDVEQREGVRFLNELALASCGLPAHQATVDVACGPDAHVPAVPMPQPIAHPANPIAPDARSGHFPLPTRVEQDCPTSDLVGPPSTRTRSATSRPRFLVPASLLPAVRCSEHNGLHFEVEVTERQGDKVKCSFSSKGVAPQWFDVAALAPLPGAKAGDTARCSLADALESIVSTECSDFASCFNASIYQLDDSLSDVFVAHTACDVPRLLGLLRDEACTAILDTTELPCDTHLSASACDADFALEACKAEKQVVEYMTDMGPVVETVPGGNIAGDPHEAEWQVADELALDVLLRAGNTLERIDSVPKGTFIGQMVMVRKLKLDESTRRLKKKNGRKSRLAHDGKHEKVIRAKRGDVESPRLKRHVEAADDTSVKMFHGENAELDNDLSIIDVGNAYCNADRDTPIGFSRLPLSVRRFAPDGCELVLARRTAVYGEETAGECWDIKFDTDILDAGLSASEHIGALYTQFLPDGGKVMALKIGDDLIVSEPSGMGRPRAKELRRCLQRTNPEVKMEPASDSDAEPTGWAGYSWRRDRTRRVVTIEMSAKIEELVTRHLPDLKLGRRPSALLEKGVSLATLCNALAPVPLTDPVDATLVHYLHTVVGDCRYPERVTPRVSLPLHCLACVVTRPPPSAKLVAHLLMEMLWDERDTGITLGGLSSPSVKIFLSRDTDVPMLDRTAPLEPVGCADATWMAPIDRYSVVVTAYSAAVVHEVKRQHLVCGSSFMAEFSATRELYKRTAYVRAFKAAVGSGKLPPTFLCSDNSACVSASNGSAALGHSKHERCRFLVLQQAVRAGEVYVEHVNDEDNWSDFLTKFVAASKIQRSLRLLTNAKNRVPP